MKYVCKQNMCTGCNACVNKCPVNAIEIKSDNKVINAVINEKKCIGCNVCVNVCQNMHDINLSYPIAWFQGWNDSEDERMKSSSGGFAYKLSTYFIEHGGVVCSCIFEHGKFVYKIIDDILKVKKFTGSKYVKSNTGDIYISIKELLSKGKKVLFIGLPCHVAGLLEYVNACDDSNLYTVDLICHGSPHSDLLCKFLNQYDIDINQLDDIKFREKGTYQLSLYTKGKVRKLCLDNVKDYFSLAFLKGLIYTENCYCCKYARIERVSDITIGDSWRSNLNDDEKKKGISLALCQSVKGLELLKNSGAHLESVCLENAIEANHQLQAPVSNTKEREKFFRLLHKGKNFNAIVRRCLPKACIVQKVKQILISLHIVSYE